MQLIRMASEHICILQSSVVQRSVFGRVGLEVEVASNEDTSIMPLGLTPPQFSHQRAQFIEPSLLILCQSGKDLSSLTLILNPPLMLRDNDALREVFVPLDSGMQVQADGQNLPLGCGILDLCNQSIAQFAELHASGIPTSPDPAAELESLQFANPQGSLRKNNQPVIQPGNNHHISDQADPAGINLMDFVIIQTGLFQAVHIQQRRIRQRIDFLQEHQIRRRCSHLFDLKCQSRRMRILRFARLNRVTTNFQPMQRVERQNADPIHPIRVLLGATRLRTRIGASFEKESTG